ncbi:MAG: Gfo/Idh/MocA family oxidoreductase [Chloroflexota bacterium]
MTLRVAILGTGFWASYAHLPGLRALPEVEVVACVGRTQERADAFAAQESIPGAYATLDSLLASPDRPDLLLVAGPDDIHPDASLAAIELGIPVFCEKPLANTHATAAAMAARAEALGVKTTVGYSFRYSPAVLALRDDLLSGALGEPWLIELFEYNAQFHPARGKPMNWKGDPAHAAAGALFEYGSHVADIADWLVGPIEAVSTSLTRVLPGARLDDIATLQLRARPPAIGILVAGWVLTGSIPGIRIRLHGSGGLAEAELSQTLPGGEAYRRFSLDGAIREEVTLDPLGDPRSAYARRHLADFTAIVAGRPSPFPGVLPTFADGARIQRVLEATLRATERWAEVDDPATGEHQIARDR